MAQSRRVIILTQWFEPEPTFKGLVFARELKRRGFDVEVVTGFPNYPEGKLYPGWKMRLRRQENIDGIAVTRLPLYPSHDASKIRRIATYSTFAASASLYATLAARRPDLVYVYQLPTLGGAAALLRATRGIPFVFDVQDLWPDALRLTGMQPGSKALAFIDRFARWVYSRAAAVVVLSPGFRELLIARGVPQAKIEVIFNWCDEANVQREGPAPGFPGADQFRILFAGNMGRAQALSSVLDAASILQEKKANISFVMLGDGVERQGLMAQASVRGLNNVVFLPRVSMADVGGYLQAADALLIHLKSDRMFDAWIPGKTQAYMAAGKPLLAALRGDAARIVEHADAGVTATPGDASSIAAAAAHLASESAERRAAMGRNGRNYYSRNMSLDVGADRFASLFYRVMTTQTSGER